MSLNSPFSLSAEDKNDGEAGLRKLLTIIIATADTSGEVSLTESGDGEAEVACRLSVDGEACIVPSWSFASGEHKLLVQTLKDVSGSYLTTVQKTASSGQFDITDVDGRRGVCLWNTRVPGCGLVPSRIKSKTNIRLEMNLGEVAKA